MPTIVNNRTQEKYEVEDRLFKTFYNKHKDQTIVFLALYSDFDVICYELSGQWDDEDVKEEFLLDWDVIHNPNDLIKEYIKSDHNSLQLALIGVDNESGFTGLAISFAKKLYFENGELLNDSIKDEDLIDGINGKVWKRVFAHLRNISTVDFKQYSFDELTKTYDENRLEKHKLCGVILGNSSLKYMSRYNSKQNTFSFEPEEFVKTKEQINKVTVALTLETSEFKMALANLQNFEQEIKKTEDQNLLENFDKILESFGYKRV